MEGRAGWQVVINRFSRARMWLDKPCIFSPHLSIGSVSFFFFFFERKKEMNSFPPFRSPLNESLNENFT